MDNSHTEQSVNQTATQIPIREIIVIAHHDIDNDKQISEESTSNSLLNSGQKPELEM